MEYKGVKYFVTGATGFVGGALAGRLRDTGEDVHAMVRHPERASALVERGVTLFAGDVTDWKSLYAGMKGVDGVFHVAGWYKLGSRDRTHGWRVNVEGTCKS